MSIFVSEPGRPVGTRLPETFRARPVGDVTELAETQSINPGRSEATDAEFQQAANAGRYKALEEYGAAAAGERREDRPYLPVSSISSQTLYSVPASATISEALTVMDEHQVHHLVIMADNNVAGLVDLRWLLGWLHENEADAMSQSLVHIELPAFLTASPETDAHQLNAALVVDAKGAASGIVTSTDYLRLYASSGRHQGTV